MAVRFRVTSLKAVVRALERYGQRSNGRVRDVMARSRERVFQRQQSLCPVDTGFMKEHTRQEASEDGLRYEVGWVAEDFPAAFYPPYQEFGTSRMAAQPSLLPALFEEEPRLVSELRQAYQ